MDTHSHADGDLSELERRLSGWRPDGEGLDPAAMLFAAGQATARPGRRRFAWPLLCGCLALVAASLGAWAATERAERLALAGQLQCPPEPTALAPPPAPVPVVPAESTPRGPLVSDGPPADSYLAFRRVMKEGLDAWPPAPVPHAEVLPGPPQPQPPVLRAWPYDGDLAP